MRKPLVNYDRTGRAGYTAHLHEHHAAPWSEADIGYLIANFETRGTEAISFALKRTYHSISTKVQELRRQGRMAKPSSRAVHRHGDTALKHEASRRTSEREQAAKYYITAKRSAGGRVLGYQVHIGKGGAGQTRYFSTSRYGGRDSALRSARGFASDLGLAPRNASVLG